MIRSSKRRWHRFSLRTLFVVVTVLCVWLAYHVNWIRQRHDAMTKWNVSTEDPFGGPPNRQPPGMLWIFGEPGYFWIDLPFPPRDGRRLTANEKAEVERVSKLFPEAEVDWFIEQPKIVPKNVSSN